VTWRLHYTAYLASLLGEQDGSEATAGKYAEAWHEFLDHVDPAAGLDGVLEAADGYRRSMRRRGLAQNTIRSRLAAIKSYFRWCHSRKLLPENPLVYFTLPRVEKNPRDTFYEAELEPVLDRMDELPRNVRLIVALGLYAGLRTGEIRRLRTRDVDLRKDRLRIHDAKGHKGRTVTILPQLHAVLEPELPPPSPRCPCCGYGTDSYLLIGERTGDMIARNYAWKAVNRYLDGAAHQLRTTKATYSLEQGVAIEELAREMGHEDINTTAGYQGRRNLRGREAVRAVTFTVEQPA
jgi:integrase